jgi:hypothetical protein
VNDQDDLEESEDFESLEDRIRRGPLLGVLLWTALIAGAVWVVLNAIVQIRLATGYPDPFSSVGAELWAVGSSCGRHRLHDVSRGSRLLCSLWLRVRQGSGSHP